MRQTDELTSRIISAGIQVHRELGPGLLESVYEQCMVMELENMGLQCESQVGVPVKYKGVPVSDHGLVLDLIVEGTVIVELKSVKQVQDIHKKQLLTYLRLFNCPVGLLMNFNEVLLKNGDPHYQYPLCALRGSARGFSKRR